MFKPGGQEIIITVPRNDRTESIMYRQTGRQTQGSTGERARRGDFGRQIPESLPASDQLDSTAKTTRSSTKFNGSVLRNIFIILANSFNSASGIDSDYQDSPAPTRPELSTLNLGKLRLAAPSIHNASNDGSMGSTIPGKLTNGNDAITPISTSAMSISSGSTPSPSGASSGGRNSQYRKINACVMCKLPEIPLDLLVRCSRCHWQYHTLCHNPKVTCTKGYM